MSGRNLETTLGIKFFGEMVGLDLYPRGTVEKVEVARIVGIMQGTLKHQGMPIREDMVCLRVQNMMGDSYNFDYHHNSAVLLASAFNVSDVKELVGEQIYLCYSSRRLEGFYKPQGSARTIW